jgi:hypothetical protein
MIPGMSGERGIKRREDNEIEFSRIVAFSDGVFAIAIFLDPTRGIFRRFTSGAEP